MSTIKTILGFMVLLLIILLSYNFFYNKKTEKVKNKHIEVTHIDPIIIPKEKKDEELILSQLKQYINSNKQYTHSVKNNEEKILKELKMFTKNHKANNQSQEILLKTIKEEGILIKKEIHLLGNKIEKNIDKKVALLKKDIKSNRNKINKKLTLLNKRTIKKIDALHPKEKYISYTQETTPMETPTEDSESFEQLDFVQTLGVVNVSDTYISNDEMM